MISAHAVTKEFHTFSGDIAVLDAIDLQVADGEFVTIFGPNGSGKTTLLNIISGIERPTSGTVLVCDKAPQDARVGFVFQNYNESLFPWRTTAKNITFPLEIQGVAKDEQQKIVEHLLAKTNLTWAKDAYIYDLSGGQKQLVSICRAIASQPDVLILDEPFSALDYSTTRQMELELLDIWQEKKITTLFVSHDIDEAIFLADRVVVMSPRPARVKEIFTVPLPRPRTLGMLTDNAFIDIRTTILKSFHYDA